MPERYQVTVLYVITGISAVDAARAVYDKLRDPAERPTRFEVSRTTFTGALGETISVPVELGKENPLGRPEVVIKEGSVCCGRCGSNRVEYLDEVERHTKLFAREGVVFACRTELEENGDGNDPRVWCPACQEESALPSSLLWE